MKQIYFWICALWFCWQGSILAQKQSDFNLTLVGNGQITFPEDVPSSYRSYNDVWGWVAEDSTEYGIIGHGFGTSIFSLADPADPLLVTTVPGVLSQWRDIKSYRDYVYVVADERDDGLLIIDMQQAPDSVSWTFWKPTLEVHGETTTLSRCHNLYIGDSLLFLAGCDGPSFDRGILIFDLAQDPMEPRFISASDPVYAHDVFALGDRMYPSNLGDGFSIVDISDPTSPVTLAFQETSRDFTHNAWSSDDNQFLFTTDERSGAFVDAYDVSDPDEIRLLDSYRPFATRDLGVIPHNVHYYKGYLVVSYYTDGIKIVDAHDPANLVEVGSYDTYFNRDGTFGGAWGAFPYLPSGLVLGSDRSTGLYVLQPDYQRAAYLEGLIIDSISQEPLEGVEVTFESELPGGTNTDSEGMYTTGLARGGIQGVNIFKPGFEEMTLEVDLRSGEKTRLNLALLPLAVHRLSGRITSADDGSPIAGASIGLQNERYTTETVTDADGFYELEAFDGAYTLVAGKWGMSYEDRQITLSGDERMDVILMDGYEDDFIFDYGWQVVNSALTRPGQVWDRGEPGYAVYNAELANPDHDIDTDLGRSCYVTGLAGNLGSNLSDTSILFSPIFDLTSYSEPTLHYHTWFYNNGVSSPDDELEIYIGNGNEEILIERINTSRSSWSRTEMPISSLIAISDSMYLKLLAADVGQVHIYEAGLDGFAISDGATTSLNSTLEVPEIAWYPNPFQEMVWCQLPEAQPGDTYLIHDLAGRQIQKGSITGIYTAINTGQLENGTYLISLIRDGKRLSIHKVIKLQ